MTRRKKVGMKMASKKTVIKLGLGLLVGLALAPKKGSESYEQLKGKLNDLYYQARELNIDDIKDNVENLRIEITKLDSTKSKEIVTNQAEKIKLNIAELVDKLQNMEVTPTLHDAVDSLKDKALEAIDFFEDNDLSQKFSQTRGKVVSKADDFKYRASDKAYDIKDKAVDKAYDLKDKAAEGIYDVTDRIVAKKDSLLGRGDDTVSFLESELEKRKEEFNDVKERVETKVDAEIAYRHAKPEVDQEEVIVQDDKDASFNAKLQDGLSKEETIEQRAKRIIEEANEKADDHYVANLQDEPTVEDETR